MIVEPFANDQLKDNLNPVGRVYYSFQRSCARHPRGHRKSGSAGRAGGRGAHRGGRNKAASVVSAAPRKRPSTLSTKRGRRRLRFLAVAGNLTLRRSPTSILAESRKSAYLSSLLELIRSQTGADGASAAEAAPGHNFHRSCVPSDFPSARPAWLQVPACRRTSAAHRVIRNTRVQSAGFTLARSKSRRRRSARDRPDPRPPLQSQGIADAPGMLIVHGAASSRHRRTRASWLSRAPVPRAAFRF